MVGLQGPNHLRQQVADRSLNTHFSLKHHESYWLHESGDEFAIRRKDVLSPRVPRAWQGIPAVVTVHWRLSPLHNFYLPERIGRNKSDLLTLGYIQHPKVRRAET